MEGYGEKNPEETCEGVLEEIKFLISCKNGDT